jgi:hypothetical protein
MHPAVNIQTAPVAASLKIAGSPTDEFHQLTKAYSK